MRHFESCYKLTIVNNVIFVSSLGLMFRDFFLHACNENTICYTILNSTSQFNPSFPI